MKQPMWNFRCTNISRRYILWFCGSKPDSSKWAVVDQASIGLGKHILAYEKSAIMTYWPIAIGPDIIVDSPHPSWVLEGQLITSWGVRQCWPLVLCGAKGVRPCWDGFLMVFDGFCADAIYCTFEPWIPLASLASLGFKSFPKSTVILFEHAVSATSFCSLVSQSLRRLVQRCPRKIDSIWFNEVTDWHTSFGLSWLFWRSFLVVYITSKQSICCGKRLKPAEVPVLLLFAHLKPKRISTNHLHGQRVTETLQSDIVGKPPTFQLKHFEQLWLFIASLYLWVIQIAVTGMTAVPAVLIEMPCGSKYIHTSRWAPQEDSVTDATGGERTVLAKKRSVATKINHPQVVKVRQGKGILKLIGPLGTLLHIIRLGWSARRPVVA